MAEDFNLGALAAQPPIQVEQDFSPEAVETRKSKWLEFFQTPQVQAALLQFGVGALQPRAPGQTQVGAIASAVGQGAEAAGRVTARQAATAQQKAELGLKERRVGAAETQAVTGQQQLDLSQQRITNQADQFTRTLTQKLGVARNSDIAKLVGTRAKAEVERADLAGEAPNFSGITEWAIGVMDAIEGKKPAPMTALPQNSEQIAAALGQFSEEEQDQRIAQAEKSGTVPPEQIAEIKRLLGRESVEAKVDGPQAALDKVSQLKELERGLRVKMIGDPKLRKKEVERGAAAKEAAIAVIQEMFPGGIEEILEAEADVLRSSRELGAAFEEAFPRKKASQSNISWLRAKFAAEKKAAREAQ